MAVNALQPGYTGEVKDRVELFHGNHLIYIGWDQHMMICAPVALPLPPAMPFGALISDVLPTTAFAAHPDWPSVDWSRVEWLKSGKPFKPDPGKSLADNGLGHKSALRLRTPGLNGIAATGS
ncbi:MAG TPA: phenol hydroxylase subunit P4 [Vineibacter sp.]|nr:phenol hydroxylase subunit P4 [Vineibacter sp.]